MQQLWGNLSTSGCKAVALSSGIIHLQDMASGREGHSLNREEAVTCKIPVPSPSADFPRVPLARGPVCVPCSASEEFAALGARRSLLRSVEGGWEKGDIENATYRGCHRCNSPRT